MKYVKFFEDFNNRENENLWHSFLEWLNEKDFELYDGQDDLKTEFLRVLSDDSLSINQKANKITSYLDEKWGLYEGFLEVSNFLKKLLSNNTINELFDSETLKDYLSDQTFDRKKLAKVDKTFLQRNIENDKIYLHKIASLFSTFNICINDPNENRFLVVNDNIYTFIFREKGFVISVTFNILDRERNDLMIFFQKEDYTGPEIDDLDVNNLTECQASEYHQKNIDEAIDILNNNLIPLFKKLGFNIYKEHKLMNKYFYN
jgi:hypothetical protein